MNTFRKLTILTGLSLAVTVGTAFGATIIVSDNFTAANVNSGFLPGEGVNSGINPPTTRLTGTVAANLSYLKKGNKGDTAYTISGNKCNITQGSQSGRFTISEDAANAFDFGTALGVANATPENPVIYDVAIAMNNKVATNAATVGRMTFGFGTVEGGGGSWSFGIQILPTTATGNYNIYKRIKIGASGLLTELNTVITNAVANASEASFLMRVTDAGAETVTYSSRVQLSIDGGTTWFYDTQTDADLVNGWHLETGTRYVSFDQAPNSGADTYDNFSISLPFPLIWTGNGSDNNWSTATNWLKNVIPVTGPTINPGDALVFSGTTQQGNVNDLNDLNVSSITFSNGGFTLSGNPFTVTTGITNITGDNALNNLITLGANGRFQPNAGSVAFNGNVTGSAKNLTVAGAGTTIINGVIDLGTGTLTKSGNTGTLTLNGTNISSGTTIVSQGLLALNGSIASTNTTISATGILGGTGKVEGPVSVTGSLSAGNGVGKLTTGSLTLTNNGTNVFEISSVTGTPGVNWDLVDAGANNVDVQALNTAQFKFKLSAVGLGNFNKDASYSWLAIGGAVQNFSADKFSVVNTGFTNDIGGGLFSVESSGSGLEVHFANNQAPTAGATNFTFAAGSPFLVSIADLLNDRTADPDGDARVLVSVISTNASVGTNATDITINSANASTESIAYVVKDSRNYRAGDTVRTATNFINIVVTNAANGGVLTISNNGGNANVNFHGNPGQEYIIQRSQNLTNWTDVATNTAAPGDGLIQFNEVPPTNPAFYRTRTQ